MTGLGIHYCLAEERQIAFFFCAPVGRKAVLKHVVSVELGDLHIDYVSQKLNITTVFLADRGISRMTATRVALVIVGIGSGIPFFIVRISVTVGVVLPINAALIAILFECQWQKLFEHI